MEYLKQLEWDMDHAHNGTEVFVESIFYVLITILQIIMTVTGIEPMSPELRHEVKDLERYIEDYRFLRDNNLHTMADLKTYIDKTELEIGALEYQREKLRNKVRREKSSEVKAENKAQRTELSNHIKPLRKKLRRAREIYDKSPRLYELLKTEAELEKPTCSRNYNYER